MPTDIAAASGVGARPHYSENYKRLVLVLLVLAYTFNFIDRTIISTIGQAIKVDLKITDTQLGLLGGLYFALLYTFLGIPIARLAERMSRVNIISLAIVIWSGFTALCGTAGNFAMLAFYRFGVGIGEAGLSPPAHSLISDYFEPRKRATALSIYAFGIPLGSMLGAMLGGWLAQSFSWRVAFVVVGLPGIAIAIAIKLLIKEPPRGHSEADGGAAVQAAAAANRPTLKKEFAELAGAAGVLFGKAPVFHMLMGLMLVSFAGYGAGQFAPPYFTRAFGLNYAEVGFLIGLVGGLSQGAGTLLGGPITDRMSKRGDHWYALVPAIGVTLAFPFLVAVYTAPSWGIAAAFMLLPGIFSYVYLGPTFAVVQNMAPSHQRATAAALMLFFVNLLALGIGPPFTGWVIDHFAAHHHALPAAVGFWDAVTGFFASDPAAYQTACPGGMAGEGAGAAADAACKGALVLGTRHGIIVAYVFALWGAAHYLLAAKGISRALGEAAASRGET